MISRGVYEKMQGMVRIIGGEWRGRKLKVPDVKDLRPTPDRVRETLFNWLAPVISGAYCLDAFAGSGVLGFEALSRGAAHVVMVDESPAVVKLLQDEALMLKTTQADIYRARLPEQLQPPARPFDIVFLDPPYQANLLKPCIRFFEEKNFLAEGAYIYLEASDNLLAEELPTNWQILKSKRAGQVAYHLIKKA